MKKPICCGCGKEMKVIHIWDDVIVWLCPGDCEYLDLTYNKMNGEIWKNTQHIEINVQNVEADKLLIHPQICGWIQDTAENVVLSGL